MVPFLNNLAWKVNWPSEIYKGIFEKEQSHSPEINLKSRRNLFFKIPKHNRSTVKINPKHNRSKLKINHYFTVVIMKHISVKL